MTLVVAATSAWRDEERLATTWQAIFGEEGTTLSPAAHRFRSASTPRYENALSIRVTSIRSAQCYDPKTGHYPCLEAGVVIIVPYQGRRAGISTTYRIDGGLTPQLTADFGRLAPAVMRQLEPAVFAAENDPDPRVSGAARGLRPKMEQLRQYDVAADAVLPLQIEAVVHRLAAAYYEQTRMRLVVTSGARTPETQADAMLTKLRLGENLLGLYTNQAAAREITDAYIAGVKAGHDGPTIRAAIAAAIKAQVAAGVYISRHLNEGAVDLRTRDLEPAAKDVLREIIAASPDVRLPALEETRPPHYHVELVAAAPQRS